MSSVSYRNDQQSDGKLPVFVFPGTLHFYFDDQRSHKQVLTLYNPYDFAVEFKVLSTNPNKYNVVESEGIIKKKCCVDIVIRAINFQHDIPREDKFRIQLYEHGVPRLIGRKDVEVYLLPTNSEQDRKSTSSRITRHNSREADEVFMRQQRDSVIIQRSLPSIPVIILSLCCILALMLPLETDEFAPIYLPTYMCLSVNQKLVAAYILGLVTMAVLKT